MENIFDIQDIYSRSNISKYLKNNSTPTVETVQRMLDDGADPNGENFETPPLYYLVSNICSHKYEGDKSVLHQIFTLLYNNGMDVNKKFQKMSILYYYNCEGRSISQCLIIPFLRPYGLDLEIKDENDMTILCYTVIHCYYSKHKINPEDIKFLIDNGADPKALDSWGRTILHRSARLFGHIPDKKVLQVLLDKGLDINHRDRDGKTALHLATESDWTLSLFDFLIENGAKCNIKDNYGMTPWDNCKKIRTKYRGQREFEILDKMKRQLKISLTIYNLGQLFHQKRCGIIVMSKICDT